MPDMQTTIRWSTVVDTLDTGIELARQYAASVSQPSISVNTVNVDPETGEGDFEVIVIGTPPVAQP